MVLAKDTSPIPIESLDIEEVLLAALMLDDITFFKRKCHHCNTLLDDDYWQEAALLRLKPIHFWRERNAWVFEVILRLHTGGMRPELFTVQYTMAKYFPLRYEAMRGAYFFQGLLEQIRNEALTYGHIVQWATEIWNSWAERMKAAGEPIPEDELKKKKGVQL